ncbi:MAG: hypothetical protein LBE67_02230 [Kocuria palustris]|nr:hypothetical protein [Kocuria palustris]
MFGSFPWSSVRARAAAVRGAKVRRGTPLRPLPGLAAACGAGAEGEDVPGVGADRAGLRVISSSTIGHPVAGPLYSAVCPGMEGAAARCLGRGERDAARVRSRAGCELRLSWR